VNKLAIQDDLNGLGQSYGSIVGQPEVILQSYKSSCQVLPWEGRL